MPSGLLQVIGGVGLFIFGMTIMTEGLKQLAGESLRRVLARFTRTPLSGAITGVIATAAIQSSGATTVMAVGFVGAGLLTFPQALGIIFGANVGTTITGWIVALFGLTFPLGTIALPLIFVGAMLRLFSRGKATSIGSAIGGFGLLFTGIGMLQTGMQGMESVLTPDVFPPDTWLGRALLIGIGMAVTVITHSSSAGVALALTAVSVGNISFAQAASLVIGMDVGTTATALMASLGGNASAVRTGLSHVVFNILSAVAAYLTLPLYVLAFDYLFPSVSQKNPEIALVAFHSAFNLLAAAIFLPFTYPFARFITWLVPSSSSKLTSRLDMSLVSQTSSALACVSKTLSEVTESLFQSLTQTLHQEATPTSISKFLENLDAVDEATRETKRYLDEVHHHPVEPSQQWQLTSCLHALDHLSRMSMRCRKTDRMQTAREHPELRILADQLTSAISFSVADPYELETADHKLKRLYRHIDSEIEPFRQRVIVQTSDQAYSVEAAFAELDAIRWLRRVTYHAWRITYHLQPQSAKQADYDDDRVIDDEN